MKQIYFIITLLMTLSINLVGITFPQEKNETSSEINDSHLITTEQIDVSMETNNTSP